MIKIRYALYYLSLLNTAGLLIAVVIITIPRDSYLSKVRYALYYLSLLNTAGLLIGLLAGEVRDDELALVVIIASLAVLIVTIPRDSYLSILIRSAIRFIIKKYKTNFEEIKNFWRSIDSQKDISFLNNKKNKYEHDNIKKLKNIKI